MNRLKKTSMRWGGPRCGAGRKEVQGRKQVSLHLTNRLLRKLDKMSRKAGQSRSEYVREMIDKA